MVTLLASVASAAVGALVTLLVKGFLDRRVETRAARRALYTELLIVLHSRSNFMQDKALAFDEPISDDGDQQQADRINALMEIDASDDVRTKAVECFKLLARFNLSLVMRVPVTVGPDGSYQHHFDKVREVDDQLRQLNMRLCLGGIHDEFRAALERLGKQVRQELHGGS